MLHGVGALGFGVAAFLLANHKPVATVAQSKDKATNDYAPKPNLVTDGQGYYITPKPDAPSIYQKYGENFGVNTDYWGGGLN